MARLYFDEQSAKMWPGGVKTLPIRPLRQKLYDIESQRLIPFLGAGASLKARPVVEIGPPVKHPVPESFDRLCAEVGLTDPSARRFLDIAIQFAQLLAYRQALHDQSDVHSAPSSPELAGQFVRLLSLEPLRPIGDTLKELLREPADHGDYHEIVTAVADLMGLSRTIPPLLTVASYFNEGERRELLREALFNRFVGVTQGTAIQERVVQVARGFVDARNSGRLADKRDYLIITTNYDPLLETRLAQENIPTCLVTVKWKTFEVVAEVLPHTQMALGLDDDAFRALRSVYEEDDSIFSTGNPLVDAGQAGRRRRPIASNFKLENKAHSLVMVYKILGCPIMDERGAFDNIVISDQDYVRFIQDNGQCNSLVPAYVQNVMGPAALFFLGYSFADWNVRSLYRNFLKDRHRLQSERQIDPDEMTDRDYIVLRSYESGDDYFFRQWDVSVLVTDLEKLAASLAA